MKSRWFILAAACASLVGAAACERQPVDSTPLSPTEAPGPRGTTSEVDDSVITTKVKTALLAEPNVNGKDIDVTTTGGQVTLSGVVPAPQIMRAEAIARGVEGVHEVVNRLTAAEGSS